MKPEYIFLTTTILFGISALCFMIAYQKIRFDKLKVTMEYGQLEEKFQKESKKKSTNKGLINVIRQLHQAGMNMCEDYKESVSLALDMSAAMLSARDITNCQKILYIANIVTDECSQAKFYFEMFDITQTNDVLLDAPMNKESDPDYQKAKAEADQMRERFTAGIAFAEKLGELLDQAQEKEMDISDARLGILIVEFANFLKIGKTPATEGDEQQLGESLNRLNKLSEQLEPFQGMVGDFQPFADNQNHPGRKGKMNAIFAEQTEKGSQEFNDKKELLSDLHEVISYTNPDDMQSHFEYMRNLASAGPRLKENQTEENEKEFIRTAVEAIPEITTISLYSIWYKFFKHTAHHTKISGATADTEDRAVKVMYLASVKLETLLQDFEKKVSGTEDEKKVKKVQEVFSRKFGF